MVIRMAQERDYTQLAEMKWLHCEEDDADYHEKNLAGVEKDKFMAKFVAFLSRQKEYRIFVASEGDVIVSAMFVYLIPKVPRPNGKARYIAYLTNVYTRKAYRCRKIGSELLARIKEELKKDACQLIFAWPSDNSVQWYMRNGFRRENEIFECPLSEE